MGQSRAAWDDIVLVTWKTRGDLGSLRVPPLVLQLDSNFGRCIALVFSGHRGPIPSPCSVLALSLAPPHQGSHLVGWAGGVFSRLAWSYCPLPKCRDGPGSPGQNNEGHGIWEDPQHRAPAVQASCPGMWITKNSPLWRTVGTREDVGGAWGPE